MVLKENKPGQETNPIQNTIKSANLNLFTRKIIVYCSVGFTEQASKNQRRISKSGGKGGGLSESVQNKTIF